MDRSTENSDGGDGDDDLARQRRKREARLDLRPVDSPEPTLADLVADVLAAQTVEPGSLDVRGYLATAGHHWRTIDAVVHYLEAKDAANAHPARWLP